VDKFGEQGAAVTDAVEALLRPLLPLFRNYGVSHLDLSQVIARLFVYDTAETLRKEGRPTTAARLALMNGLTRGEVEKHLGDREDAVRRRATKMTQVMIPSIVLSAWNTDSRFSTPYGAALDLSLKPGDGRRSFFDLVSDAAPGADPDTVLDQLVAAGCVEVVEGIFVRCTNWAYIPAGVNVEKIARMGQVISLLGATLTKNLLELSDIGSYPERQVVSDFPVSDEGRAEIRRWIVEQCSQFLTSMDAWITENRSRLEATNGRRVGLDMFMFDVASESAATPGIQSVANG
jgi:hypothetical protein